MMNRVQDANTAATQSSRDDDTADHAFGIDPNRAAYELQVRRMRITAILEADPDLAF